MTSRMRMLGLLAILPALASGGCIIIGVSWGGPSHWTENETQRLELDTADVSAIEVRTHNGSIAFMGESGGAPAYVDVTKKAGGNSIEDAQAAFDAIEVYAEPAGDGLTRIGWKWNRIKALGWRARVSFDIHSPGDLALDATTHNGPIKVRGVTGDTRLVTHNGRVNVDSTGGRLYAETHNGRINAVYAGGDITLITHNGRVVADLTGCSAIDGSVVTHNGSIEIAVSENTSARLNCRTHNGAIRCGVPIQNSEIRRRHLAGTIGMGGGKLSLITHNGSVRIKKAG